MYVYFKHITKLEAFKNIFFSDFFFKIAFLR